MALRTVVVDPGHGGTFEVGGSSWNNAISFSGVMEKSMTLQLGLLVRQALRSLSTNRLTLKVFMTRETDMNLGLPDRAGVARVKKADRFLSIHFNGFDKRARGVETLVRPAAEGNVNYEEDREFATRIQRAVFQTIKRHDPKTRDRGVKDQKLGVLSDVYLGNTPTNHRCRACLAEIEFIDVEAVDKLLNTNPDAPAVRDDIAKSIAKAIVDDLKNG